MTTESHIQLSALLPHPPIIVPEVGGARLRQCSGTVNACREVARQLVAARPDRLMLISPHSPRKGRKFGIWSGHDHRGNLAAFGAPGASISLPTDPCLIDALEFEVMGVGNYWRISSGPLDHGAVVPLWFLQQAGWQGPTTILSLPAQSVSHQQLWAIGEELALAASRCRGKVAMVASGDMSHRCLPGAPAGFHARGVEFDRELTSLIAKKRYREIADIDPDLRSLAAEDTIETSMIVTAATSFESTGGKVLSYEHPFGVGYLVAIFHDHSAGSADHES